MVEEVYATVSPLLERAGLDLVDIEVTPRRIVVTVDRLGGVDLDSIASITRTVSTALDSLESLDHRYELEVSSPGLERRLRTPAQFARAVGERVSLLVSSAESGKTRIQGKLVSSDADEVVVEPDDGGGLIRFPFARIERAKTLFEWGATPPRSPSRGPKGTRKADRAKRAVDARSVDVRSVARSTEVATGPQSGVGTAVSAATVKNIAKTERVKTS
ncbi:MAG: ribosome maturation factor RimP [Actinobacteria bacterium]|nr:ribosome maturation factor RimP [Actinomycetota bacterium]